MPIKRAGLVEIVDAESSGNLEVEHYTSEKELTDSARLKFLEKSSNSEFLLLLMERLKEQVPLRIPPALDTRAFFDSAHFFHSFLRLSSFTKFTRAIFLHQLPRIDKRVKLKRLDRRISGLKSLVVVDLGFQKARKPVALRKESATLCEDKPSLETKTFLDSRYNFFETRNWKSCEFCENHWSSGFRSCWEHTEEPGVGKTMDRLLSCQEEDNSDGRNKNYLKIIGSRTWSNWALFSFTFRKVQNKITQMNENIK